MFQLSRILTFVACEFDVRAPPAPDFRTTISVSSLTKAASSPLHQATHHLNTICDPAKMAAPAPKRRMYVLRPRSTALHSPADLHTDSSSPSKSPFSSVQLRDHSPPTKTSSAPIRSSSVRRLPMVSRRRRRGRFDCLKPSPVFSVSTSSGHTAARSSFSTPKSSSQMSTSESTERSVQNYSFSASTWETLPSAIPP